jgi:hypothetical protein
MPPDATAVPEDFPQPDIAAAVAGFQSKLLLVSYGGRFYLPGATPPERFARWSACEKLAQDFVETCRHNEARRYAHLSETKTLERYQARLLQTGAGAEAELQWVVRRAAGLLGWPVPDNSVAGRE